MQGGAGCDKANSSGDKSNNNSGSQRHFPWSWQEGGASVQLTFLAWGPSVVRSKLCLVEAEVSCCQRYRKVEAEMGQIPKTGTQVSIGYGIFQTI